MRWGRPFRCPRRQTAPAGGRCSADPRRRSACGRTSTGRRSGPIRAAIYAARRSGCSALPGPCRTTRHGARAGRTVRRRRVALCFPAGRTPARPCSAGNGHRHRPSPAASRELPHRVAKAGQTPPLSAPAAFPAPGHPTGATPAPGSATAARRSGRRRDSRSWRRPARQCRPRPPAGSRPAGHG